MKKRILSAALLMGAIAANAQVGIGVKEPNLSAELTIEAPNRGLLIPNVKLSGALDIKTISNGNVESLLVFNTNTTDLKGKEKVNNLTPGYHYWDGKRWARLTAEQDIPQIVVNHFQDILNLDEGSVTNLIKAIFKGKLSLDGGLEFKDKNSAAANLLLANAGIQIADGGVTPQKIKEGKPGEVLVTDANGKVKWVKGKDAVVEKLVKDNETITTLVDNGDGTITYTNEAGKKVTVDLAKGPKGDKGEDGKSAKVVDNQDGTVTITDGNGGTAIVKNGKDGISVTTVVEKDGTITVKEGEKVIGTIVNGKDGKSVTVVDNQDGTVTITDGNGGTATVKNGKDGKDGISVTTVVEKDGTITVKEGEKVIGTIVNGKDGKSVTVVDNQDGTVTITDGNGGTATVKNGVDGKSVTGVKNDNGSVTITDADGKEIATIVNGKDGKDGVDGKSVTGVKNDDGSVTITDADGKEITTIVNGTNGKDGVDGKSVKGVKNDDGSVTITDADGKEIATIVNGTNGKDGIGGKTIAGDNIKITGEGTEEKPYIVNAKVPVVKPADGTANNSNVIVTEVNGENGKEYTVDVKAAMPKVFYMPPVMFDTSSKHNVEQTRNLYEEYVAMFGGSGVVVDTPIDGTRPAMVKSDVNATIPVYEQKDLNFFVPYYDPAVFSGVSVDEDGVLTYTVKKKAKYGAFMTVVFVVKDQKDIK